MNVVKYRLALLTGIASMLWFMTIATLKQVHIVWVLFI